MKYTDRAKFNPRTGDRLTVSLDGRELGVIVKTTIGNVWVIEGGDGFGFRGRKAAATALSEMASRAIARHGERND